MVGMSEKSASALLVIRAWREDSPEPLRAEIHLTHDVSFGYQQAFSTARPERVVEAVRAFLEDVVSLR